MVGEVLELDPDRVRVVRPDSLSSLPSNSPVGSRMAIMLGGAAFHAAQKLKARLIAIAAHDLGIPADRAVYRGGDVSDPRGCNALRSWQELVDIAHRNFHLLPPGMEPGLQAATHAGADRRHAAGARRARADVSLLRLRVSCVCC